MAAIYFHDGEWGQENPKLVGPGDHALWLGSTVFDAARAFRGLAPDLETHCARLLESATALALKSPLEAAEILELCKEGVRRMPNPKGDIFIRPVLYATEGGGYGGVVPDPDSTKLTITCYEMALPDDTGFSAGFVTRQRPARTMAPTTAKSGALYPNVARSLVEASGRGFDNAIVLDAAGNVAEFAAANLWIVKDGVALTPIWNGTFLNGITRRRVLALLADDGVEAREAVLTPEDVLGADEVFSSGNYAKVKPCNRIEDRDLQPGPVARRARELYFEFAESCAIL